MLRWGGGGERPVSPNIKRRVREANMRLSETSIVNFPQVFTQLRYIELENDRLYFNLKHYVKIYQVSSYLALEIINTNLQLLN
jgi:hypothetical protein